MFTVAVNNEYITQLEYFFMDVYPIVIITNMWPQRDRIKRLPNDETIKLDVF